MQRRSTLPAAENLPFPLASVLWDFASTGDRTRLDPLFNFFEVSVKFTTTLLLSGLASDGGLFDTARRSWQGRIRPSVTMQTPTLGSWAVLGAGAAKAVRALAQQDAAAVKAAFAVDDHQRVTRLASRDVVALHDEAVRHRNEWRGHGSIASPAEVARRHATLSDRLVRLSGLHGSIFSGWSLIHGNQCSYSRGAFDCRVDLMVGANPRFAEAHVTLNHPVSADWLHMWCDDASVALPLAPLVNTFQPAESSDPAVYFYDRGDSKLMRWLSYHYEPAPERNEVPSAAVASFLAALDAPAPGEMAEDHAASARASQRGPDSADVLKMSSPVQQLLAACTLVGLQSMPHNGGFVVNDSGATLGVVNVMSDELTVVANVPIDSCPFLPGALVWELPIGPTGTPATRLSAFARSGVSPSLKLLVTAWALTRGWELGGSEFFATVRRAGPVIGDATAAVAGWGAGLQDAPPPQGLAWSELWRPVADRLEDAGVGLAPRMLNQPCLRIAFERYMLEIRVDGFGPVISVVLHDDKVGPKPIAALMANRTRVEGEYGRPALWIRELTALRIVDRPHFGSRHDDVDELRNELSARATSLATGTLKVLRDP